MLPSDLQVDRVEGRVQFRVAVLNHQKAMDRWERRRELVIEQLGELRPDVLALNEIDMPIESARWLQHVALERLGLRYSLLQQSQVNALSEIGAKALLVRFPIVEAANLDYRSRDRVVQVARLEVDGTTVDIYVTHLQAGDEEEAARQVQVEQLLRWIDSRDDVGARVICGDFTATPDSPSARNMAARFQSVQSAPTASTVNAPLEKRGPDWRPLSRCIDYIGWAGLCRYATQGCVSTSRMPTTPTYGRRTTSACGLIWMLRTLRGRGALPPTYVAVGVVRAKTRDHPHLNSLLEGEEEAARVDRRRTVSTRPVRKTPWV